MTYVWIIHVASVFILVPIDLPVWLKAILAVLVLYSGLSLLASRADPDSPAAFIIDEHDQCHVITKAGDSHPAVILPGTLVHPWLTLLRFRYGQKTRPVLLLADNTEPQQFRRLRVRLRFGSISGVS